MHQHDDHHHHDCDHDHDDHGHRDLHVGEAPLDAANQSLADALRASFGVLKLIMLVLVVLYLVSNIRSIEGSEQALVVRMGALRPGVHDAGLVKAFPFPVDEVLRLPTRKSSDLVIDSHTFHRQQSEIGKPLSFISRGDGEGLNPSLDGALLTADAGLVHVQWKVTYKIDDVRSYVSTLMGDKIEAAEELIRTLVETVGIHVAAEHTAEEMIRTRVSDVQDEMKRRLNERLTELSSGIHVALIEMYEPTPPLQVRHAFDNTQRAENNKQAKIRDAEQNRTRMLNETAGAAHERLIALLDELDAARRAGHDTAELESRRDELLERDAEGNAGRLIKDAGAYLAVEVGRMQSDVELYRTLLPEFERNPEVLMTRYWEQAKQKLFASPGVLKVYRPANSPMRLHIGLDPEQSRLDEAERLKEKEFDPDKLRPRRMVPIGPGAG